MWENSFRLTKSLYIKKDFLGFWLDDNLRRCVGSTGSTLLDSQIGSSNGRYLGRVTSFKGKKAEVMFRVDEKNKSEIMKASNMFADFWMILDLSKAFESDMLRDKPTVARVLQACSS